MPNPFAAAASAAAAATDSIFGESFDFHPMRRPGNVNARAVADPARAVATVRGVYGAPSARVNSGAVTTVAVKPEQPGHASSRPFLSLELASLPYPPARGDRVRRLEPVEWYEIAEVLPSQPGFARLDLNQIPAPI